MSSAQYLFALDGSGTDDTGQYLDATFQSHQDRKHGPGNTGWKCAVWPLRYHFVVRHAVALIDNTLTKAQPGRPAYEGCS